MKVTKKNFCVFSLLMVCLFHLQTITAERKISNQVDSTKVLSEGAICPNFQFVDFDDVKMSLSSLRGKYVFIDVWASWCYPCRKEYPYLKELEAKMKDCNIVFLGISIDQTSWRWKGAITGIQMTGLQWLDQSGAFGKSFGIDKIPRFILIAPNGRVVNDNMTRPSSPNTEIYLKKLRDIKQKKQTKRIINHVENFN